MVDFESTYQDLWLIGMNFYHWSYFEAIICPIVLLISIIVGNLTKHRKWKTILCTINDAENTKKYLISKINQRQIKIKWYQYKKTTMLIISFAVVLAIIGQLYMFKASIKMTSSIIVIMILIWIIGGIRLKFLKWDLKKIQKKLNQISLYSNEEIKQVLILLTKQINEHFKHVFQKELDDAWYRQGKQQCKLFQCYEEKQLYNSLYDLYKVIIDQIHEVSWCTTCQNNMNINVNQLKLTNMTNMIQAYHRALTEENSISIEQKKQMANNLLKDWQKVSSYLQNICKRGCCIRCRLTFEQVKNKYHKQTQILRNKLKQVKNNQSKSTL